MAQPETNLSWSRTDSRVYVTAAWRPTWWAVVPRRVNVS